MLSRTRPEEAAGVFEQAQRDADARRAHFLQLAALLPAATPTRNP
jgi:hypothetical protein